FCYGRGRENAAAFAGRARPILGPARTWAGFFPAPAKIKELGQTPTARPECRALRNSSRPGAAEVQVSDHPTIHPSPCAKNAVFPNQILRNPAKKAADC